jgi:hypothetical protein
MRSRFLIAVLSLLLALAALTEPASAGRDDVAGEVLISSCSVEYPCVVLTGEAGEEPVGGGSVLPDWMLECSWVRMGAWEFLAYAEANAILPVADNVSGPDEYPTPEAAAAALYAATGATDDDTIIAVLCPHSDMFDAGIFRGGPIYERWIEGEPPPQNVLDLIIARAQAAITQLDTWLWIDPAVWQPLAATPEPIFGIAATVTATPHRVTFHRGGTDGPAETEGSAIDCNNNTGAAWTPDAETTSCSLTWHHTSATGPQTLTATIHWHATWQCTASCGTGTLPDYITQTTRTVTVAELQTLGTQ